MNTIETKRKNSCITDTAAVERALYEASRQALLSHKQSGTPIAIWQDGRVVVVPAEEIVVPPKLEG